MRKHRLRCCGLSLIFFLLDCPPRQVLYHIVMLRPSLWLVQALPTCKAHPEHLGSSSEQSLIWFEDGAVCFRMLRSKNKPKGSGVIKRVCSCQGGVATWPCTPCGTVSSLTSQKGRIHGGTFQQTQPGKVEAGTAQTCCSSSRRLRDA